MNGPLRKEPNKARRLHQLKFPAFETLGLEAIQTYIQDEKEEKIHGIS